MIEYVEYITTLFSNSVLQAILYIFGSILTAKFADWIITRFLSRMVSHTKTSIDDKIIQILQRPIYYSILFMGLGISIRLFSLPEVITFSLIGLFKTVAIIIWSAAMFQSFIYLIKWYGKQNKHPGIIKVHTLPIFDNVGKVVIFILATYFILISWNINVTGLLATSTVLVAILGFAAKDTVANLFSGFFIKDL